MFRLTNYPLLTFVVTFALMWLSTLAGMYIRKHWRTDAEKLHDDFGVVLGRDTHLARIDHRLHILNVHHALRPEKEP